MTASVAGRLLLAESDSRMRRVLAFRLRREGFDATELAEPLNVKDKISVDDPDLVLLELAGVDRFDLLADLRPATDAAVIAMVNIETHDDQAVALDLGADDCVARPVCLRTVVARSRAVLRRRLSTPPRQLHYDPLHIDLSARTVRLGGQTVDLTAREFDLLAYLASHPAQVFTRQQLLSSVWNSSPH